MRSTTYIQPAPATHKITRQDNSQPNCSSVARETQPLTPASPLQSGPMLSIQNTPPDAFQNHAEGEGMHTEQPAPRTREIPPRRRFAYDLFEELWEDWTEHAYEQASTAFGVHCSHADSDLERVFLAVLMFIKPDYACHGYGGALDLAGQPKLYPQHPCGPYRIDFAIVVPPFGPDGEEIRIAVECDGQYYHDRTEKQAARDKKRDRFLTLNGWRVMRFVETEIMKDPRGCADQVSELIGELLDRQVVRAVAKQNEARGG